MNEKDSALVLAAEIRSARKTVDPDHRIVSARRGLEPEIIDGKLGIHGIVSQRRVNIERAGRIGHGRVVVKNIDLEKALIEGEPDREMPLRPVGGRGVDGPDKDAHGIGHDDVGRRCLAVDGDGAGDTVK